MFGPTAVSEPLLPDNTNRRTAHDVILENANSCLRQSCYPQLWKVTCGFHGGVLTLHGVVGSYFLKQLAHIAIADVVGIEEVANRIDVQYPDSKSNGPDNRP